VGVCLADIAKGARFVIWAVLVTSTAPTISTGELEGLLGVVIGGALLAGLVIILARHAVSSPKSEPASSVVRSWIAVSLVLGLLAFCAASFRIDDSTLRSTLFGGLITSVGAAIAFYFSSKSADQARTDILNTALAMSQGGTPPTAFSASTPPNGTVNVAYPAYAFVADGTPAPSYSLAMGSPPDGLALEADGTLHGTPSRAGDFTFSIVARNSAGSVRSGDVTMSVHS
jgi:hypothetical protein